MRRESEPTQTANGPECLNSTTSLSGLLSLLLEEVQETLKGLRIRLVQPGRSTGEFLVIGRRLGHHGAGRVVETAEGEEECSQQNSRHIPSQEHVDESVRLSGFHRAKGASFHERKNHPCTKRPWREKATISMQR